MTTRAILTAGLCIALAAPFAAHAASPQPTVGFYRVVTQITAATPTKTCTSFGQTVGSSATGVFNYPGPNATGAEIRFADASTGKVTANIFTKTPAAHATTWSGSLSVGNEPSGPYFNIPFTATITYLTANSFTAVEKATVTVGGNKCAISENIVFVLTGT